MEKVKMKIKKHISLFLSIVVVITSCSLAYFAKAQKSININSELLDSVLSDRYWVIETLVNGDISNNPYSYINPSSTSQNLLDEVLAMYRRGRTGSISSHSVWKMIGWHYKLYKDAERQNSLAALFNTGRNLVFGFYKKKKYVMKNQDK